MNMTRINFRYTSRKNRRKNTNAFETWSMISPDTNHQLSYSRLKQNQEGNQKQNNRNGLANVADNFYIRPFELSVDTMQYLVNTGKLFKITKRQSLGSASANWRKAPETKTLQYLSIVDFPSIQIEQSPETRHTSRHEGFYYNVYESPKVAILTKEELLANFVAGQYYNNVMVVIKDGNKEMRQSMQNISYVKNAIESIQEPDPAKWKCDLAGIPEKYVFRVEVVDTNGKRHMIVGYPSARTMRQYTDLDKEHSLREIHKQMSRKSTVRFAELFNFALDKGGKAFEKDKIKLDNLEDEIYKFALGNRPYFYNSIINAYKLLAKEQPDLVSPEEAARFESEFNEKVKTYYNLLGNRYLNKPITRIRYTFFILEEADAPSQATGMQWVPAVYNIRQLEARHLPILKQIEKLIKLEIPLLFGIISQADYEAGLQYELFNSYYKYVNFFHITSEYLHTMSNFTDYAHNLKDSITLEEIIYSVGREAELGRPYWRDMRFDYKIRNYRLDYAESNKVNNQVNNPGNPGNRTKTNGSRGVLVNTVMNSRYGRGRMSGVMSRRRSTNINILNATPEQVRNIEILLMYEDTYANYTFIYKVVDAASGRASFRKMKLKPNLKAFKQIILDTIGIGMTMKIKTVYECDVEFIKLLALSKRDIPRNYIIEADEEIKYEDLFWKIFLYNPLVVKSLYNPGRNKTINTAYFYKNLLTMSADELMKLNPASEPDFYNIYLELPVLIKNYIATEYYKKGLDNFRRTGHQLECRSNTLIDTNYAHYKDCADIPGTEKCVINCVYFNSNECGYNFIEIIDIYVANNKKRTVFVIPFDKGASSASSASSAYSNYLGNFLDLRIDHLPMLYEIKRIYQKQQDGTSIFLHKVSTTPKYYCIHFHILESQSEDSLYKRVYPIEERGTFLTQELELNNIINNLVNDSNYYVNYNVSLLTSG